MVVLTNSSCAGATRHHVPYIETRQGNRIFHESWTYDESFRRAEEKNENKDEKNQNNEKDQNKNDNNNQNHDINDNQNNGANDEQASDSQSNDAVSKIEQHFLDMFYLSPREWTTKHWGTFAGMMTLVLVSILCLCSACVIPSCCPRSRQPELLLDNKDSCGSSLSDSAYTSEESHPSDERPYRQYDDRGQCYIKYTPGMPPTYAD